MINNAFVIKDLLTNLLKRDDIQISKIYSNLVTTYSVYIHSKEVIKLSLLTLNNIDTNFVIRFNEHKDNVVIPLVHYSRPPNDDDYELLHLVDFKYRQQLRLKEQTMNRESISNKFNAKWVKLKDFYININAITKVSLSSVSYVDYVAIYTGDDRPELVDTNYYNKWVKENNLDLPIFKENSYESNI